jgi:hypothetical protein
MFRPGRLALFAVLLLLAFNGSAARAAGDGTEWSAGLLLGGVGPGLGVDGAFTLGARADVAVFREDDWALLPQLELNTLGFHATEAAASLQLLHSPYMQFGPAVGLALGGGLTDRGSHFAQGVLNVGLRASQDRFSPSSSIYLSLRVPTDGSPVQIGAGVSLGGGLFIALLRLIPIPR